MSIAISVKKYYNRSMEINRAWAMPNSKTFDIKPIRELINRYCRYIGWVDPFARNSKLCEFTNDINPETSAEQHMDALDFLRTFNNASINGVLYDPPYSPRQIKECYDGIGRAISMADTSAAFWGNQKKEIGRIIKSGGVVISFGWNSGGIGKKYGFEIIEILLVAHGGWHNDTICTIERKK